MQVKETMQDPAWRAPQDVCCTVTDCAVTATARAALVPPGWKEVSHGLICPRHVLTVVVMDTTPEDVMEEAIIENAWRPPTAPVAEPTAPEPEPAPTEPEPAEQPAESDPEASDAL